MVTEVSHQPVRYSSVLICCFVISWFVQFFSPKITGHLSPWSIIRTGGDFGQETAALFWADDSAPTFISSGHNLSLQAQLSFQLKNKFFCLSKVRTKSTAVNCRNTNTFWQLHFCCLVCLPSQNCGACCFWQQFPQPLLDYQKFILVERARVSLVVPIYVPLWLFKKCLGAL